MRIKKILKKRMSCQLKHLFYLVEKEVHKNLNSIDQGVPGYENSYGNRNKMIVLH